MATHIVMDHSGDSRHHFSNTDARALADAERRFLELTGKGFTAAARTAEGDVSRISRFDPTVEETLFFPRLVGGQSAGRMHNSRRGRWSVRAWAVRLLYRACREENTSHARARQLLRA